MTVDRWRNDGRRTRISWRQFYARKLTLQNFLRNLHWHSFFLELVYREAGGEVLEVGSGSGSMSTFLSYLGLNVISIDNDIDVLESARELNRDLCEDTIHVLADAFNLPLRHNVFNIVFHQGFLEHFDDKEIVLLIKEQLRAAKRVALSVPSKYYPNKDFGNERLMSDEDWRRILHDFTVKQSAYYY